jgi:AcrR family transcriptional regulator
MLNENLIAELVRRKVINDTFRKLTAVKKNHLYQAAISLFGEYGYDGLAVDRFCSDAQISKGSFFQYFPSKMHLLEFSILLFDDFLENWITGIKQREGSSLARERLRYLYRSIVTDSQIMRSEQRFYLFATKALAHAGVAIEGIELERHLHDYVAEIIKRGEQTGEIRGDFDPDLTGYLVTLIMSGLVERQFSQKRLPSEQVEEYLISFLFDGVTA